eukprot:PhF_6_TR26318/c0_g1_i2/m.37833/K16302/CNNM; metal transporter CNNM
MNPGGSSTHHLTPKRTLKPTRPPRVIINPFEFVNDTCALDQAELWSEEWWISAAMSLFCTFSACLTSGLTMGLVCMDDFQLSIVNECRLSDCRSDEERERLEITKRRVARVLPLVSRHHLLIVTLLLADAAASELLPLALDNIVPEWLAVIFSVTLILIFVEIVPSSLFTGPNQLRLGAFFVPFVWFLVYASFLIAYPIAWLLDIFLGHEEVSGFTAAELKALFRLHGPRTIDPPDSEELTSGAHDQTRLGHLSAEEVRLLCGVIDMGHRNLAQYCVPVSRLITVKDVDVVGPEMICRLAADGNHSRVLVVAGSARHRILGVLEVHSLHPSTYGLALEELLKHKHKGLRPPLFLDASITLLDAMATMQAHMDSESGGHLAVVARDARLAQEQLEQNSHNPSLASATSFPESVSSFSDVDVCGIVTIGMLLEQLYASPSCEVLDKEQYYMGIQQQKSGECVYSAFDMPHVRLLKKIRLARQVTTERMHLDLSEELMALDNIPTTI